MIRKKKSMDNQQNEQQSMDNQQTEQKFVDREDTEKRVITGTGKKVISYLAIALAVFEVYVNSIGMVPSIIRNAIFLGFLLMIAFLIYPATKKSPMDRFTKLDVILSVLGGIAGFYLAINYDIIHLERASIAITRDYVFAVLAIILILEAARRAMGYIIPALAVFFILYARYGQMFPGMFGHGGFSWQRILYRMYMTYEGIFGLTLTVAATYIFIFILFGSFLQKSGCTDFFNDIALAAAGKKRGGPAQVAVISSGLMGTLSGSAVANVATTGAITIPLMKKTGYSPEFSGAVEAAASTGGMIMPPIMGAAAFIMSSYLDVPYLRIVLAAIIPALLYFTAISITVDIRAKKLGLKGIEGEDIPSVMDVLKEKGILVLPLVVITFLLVIGRSPMYAGFSGIIATILVSFVKKENRMSLKDIISALESASMTAIQVGVACAACGLIVGVVGMTGVGSVLAHNIIKLSGGVVFIALLAVMVISIILSMGLPSTAVYIVVAVTAAPALVNMGVLPLAAHFFVFWFGAMSNVTPPVALASFTAAGLAGSDPMKTGFVAFRLVIAGFLIPFMMVYSPEMLMEGATFFSAIRIAVTGLFGVYSLSIAMENYMNGKLNIIERVIFFAAAILMIDPGMYTDIVGIAMFAVTLFIHRKRVIKKVA